MPESDTTVDSVVAASRAALLEVTGADTVGDLVDVSDGGEGVRDVRFANSMPGYPGWFWTVSVSVADGVDAPSVLELGLVPGDGALIAPDWIPWSERLAEYRAAQEAKDDESASEDDGESDGDDEDLDESDDDLDETDVLGQPGDELDGVDFEDGDNADEDEDEGDDSDESYDDEVDYEPASDAR